MKINALRSCSGIHSPTGVVRIILFSNTILQNPGKHELRTDFQEGAFAAFVVASHGQYFKSHSSEKALANDIALVSGVVPTDPPAFPINRSLNFDVAIDNDVPPVPVMGTLCFAAA